MEGIEMECNFYAPIMIVTCNRYQHLRRCINSLKQNLYAKETEIYISVDYPPSEKYVEGWQRVCEELQKPIDGFKKIHIFFQKKNLGVDDNCHFLYEKIFTKYDRVIFTEDDNEFSANFLEYVDKGLEKYKDDPKVYGICGYGYNYDFQTSNNNVIALTNFCMWGVGLWRDKEKIIKNQLSKKMWEKRIKDPFLMLKLYGNRKRLFSRAVGQIRTENQELRLTDINRGIILALNNWYTINPVISKVRNIGWDGSGLNIVGNKDKQMEYLRQPIDQKEHFEYRVKDLKVLRINNKLLDSNDEWNRERAKWYNDPLTYIRYLICGK